MVQERVGESVGGICTFKSSEEFVDVQLYLRRWHSKLFEILRES
ncbi:MAG: hypothetical protein SPI35_06125 [Porphyromonas sp.]|nr:hypothetical protein [Porphyromonas sp.]